MEKIIEVGSWESAAGPQVYLVRTARDGQLRGADRREFLKVAGHIFEDRIGSIHLEPGDIPIHIKAVHALENWGCNRNGDAFTRETCERFHDTFVKRARLYKMHQNTDPKKSYGVVKLSAFNPQMARIELLVIGNGSREAARRRGSLKLADEDIAALENREDVPFSMACKVAYDVCANCGNKAKSRDQYCNADSCVNPDTGRRGLGCRHGLGKLAADGIVQYVENPEPHFFDISIVKRPADRQAYGSLAEYITKSAAAPLGGSELRDWYSASCVLLGPDATRNERALAAQQRALLELASAEKAALSQPEERDKYLAAAAKVAWDTAVEKAAEMPTRHISLGALADRRVVLPVAAFLRAFSSQEMPSEKLAGIAAGVARHLPGMLSKLAADPDIESKLRNNPFRGAILDERWGPDQRRSAEKLASWWSMEAGAIRKRASLAAIRKIGSPAAATKSAAAAGDSSMYESLAEQYALYLVATVAAQYRGCKCASYVPESESLTFPEHNLTLRAIAVQNMIER